MHKFIHKVQLLKNWQVFPDTVIQLSMDFKKNI